MPSGAIGVCSHRSAMVLAALAASALAGCPAFVSDPYEPELPPGTPTALGVGATAPAGGATGIAGATGVGATGVGATGVGATGGTGAADGVTAGTCGNGRGDPGEECLPDSPACTDCRMDCSRLGDAARALEVDGKLHCYQLVETPLAFEAAQAYCDDRRGHLVTVLSEAEQAIVAAHRIDVWIGARDGLTESDDSTADYHWVTSEDWVFEPASGLDINLQGNYESCCAHCLAVSDDVWVDRLCVSEPQAFVCEWEPISF